MSKALKKVTMFLPEDLLKVAQKATGEGLTPTVRKGLELIAAQTAFDGLRKLRGSIDLKLNVKTLRTDKK
jgi:hypothetical protein